MDSRGGLPSWSSRRTCGYASRTGGFSRLPAREAGCPLDELLHVGDSLENDVAGANEAGAHTVWLNRESRANETGNKADFEITSLADLPEAL